MKKSTKPTELKLNIFEVLLNENERQWVAAENAGSALSEAIVSSYSYDEDPSAEILTANVRPLTKEELKTYRVTDEDTGRSRSFAAELRRHIKMGVTFPTQFAWDNNF